MSFAKQRSEATVTAPRMNNAQVVEALKAEAAKNPVFNAVALVFAMRERARQQVTIGALSLRMAQEGYNFKRSDYQNVLRFLASIGIGTLELGEGNTPRALKNIRLTLQSIGEAALGSQPNVEKFQPAFEYQRVMAPIAQPLQTIVPAAVMAAPLKAALTVHIDGKPITFEMPQGLTAAQLGEMLAQMYTTNSKGQS